MHTLLNTHNIHLYVFLFPRSFTRLRSFSFSISLSLSLSRFFLSDLLTLSWYVYASFAGQSSQHMYMLIKVRQFHGVINEHSFSSPPKKIRLNTNFILRFEIFTIYAITHDGWNFWTHFIQSPFIRKLKSKIRYLYVDPNESIEVKLKDSISLQL